MKSHTLKRLAALLLALAMLFTLASCGKKDETKDDDADPKTEQVSDKNDKNNQDDDAPVATKKPAKEDDDAEPTEKPSKGEETTPSAKAPEVSGSWGTQLDGDEASFRFNDDGSFSAVLAGEDIVGTYTVADGVISLTTSDGDLQELPYCFSNDGALLLLAMGGADAGGYLVLENGNASGALRGTDFIGTWESDEDDTLVEFDDSSVNSSDGERLSCSLVVSDLLLYADGAGVLCVYRFVDSDTLNLTVDNETVQLHRAGSGAVSAPGGDEPSSPFGGGADTPTSLNDITGSWSTLLDGSEVSFIYGADGSFTAVLDGENVQGSYTVSNGVVSMTSSDGDLQELPYSFNNDGTLLLLGLGSTNEDGYLVLQGENGSPAGALRGTDFIGDWESDAGYTVLFDDSSMSTSDDDNFLCSFVGDGLLLYFSGAGMIFSYEFEDPDTLMLTYGDEVEYLYRVGSR